MYGCMVQSYIYTRTNSLSVVTKKIQISDRRFGRTHLAIYGPKWAQKKKYVEKTKRKREKLDLLRQVEISAS